MNNHSFVLVTHFYIYSSSQALRDYLRMNKGQLLYISHPLGLSDSKTNDRSYSEISSGDTIESKKESSIWLNNFLLRMLFELLLTIWWVITSRKRYDLYVGVDNLNAVHGLILRQLGFVRKVVYYSIDYFPTRFENKVLNTIYHAIDKFCVEHTDETWNAGKQMPMARFKHNTMNPRDYPRQYHVPIGIWYDHAPRLPFSKINKKKLIFAGHLVPHMGVDLVIRALPDIRKKISDIELHIIGGGQEFTKLKELAKKLHVADSITFYGWVRDRKKLEKLMADGAVGLATFNTDILDDKVKNADPGKIKDYMLLGMPVIVTDAISTKDEIVKSRSGIVIPYKKEEVTNAVIQLLDSEKTLREYRKNALLYVKQFDFSTLFTPHITRLVPS